MTEVNVKDLPEATLDQLLAVPDSNTEWIAIPEWGYKVQVKGLSKADQIKARKQASVRGKVDETKLEGLVFVYGMVTPKVTPDQLDRLYEKSSGVVDRILGAILRLSGMDGFVDEEAEADFRE